MRLGHSLVIIFIIIKCNLRQSQLSYISLGSTTARQLHVLDWLFLTSWTVACRVPSVHGISQARMLEWVVAISFSRDKSKRKSFHWRNTYWASVIYQGHWWLQGHYHEENRYYHWIFAAASIEERWMLNSYPRIYKHIWKDLSWDWMDE